MIEPLKDLPASALGFVCHGRVTKQDYDTVLMPGQMKIFPRSEAAQARAWIAGK